MSTTRRRAVDPPIDSVAEVRAKPTIRGLWVVLAVDPVARLRAKPTTRRWAMDLPVDSVAYARQIDPSQADGGLLRSIGWQLRAKPTDLPATALRLVV